MKYETAESPESGSGSSLRFYDPCHEKGDAAGSIPIQGLTMELEIGKSRLRHP